MIEREQKRAEDALKAAQDASAFEMTARIYGSGATDPATGQPVKPVTRETLLGVFSALEGFEGIGGDGPAG